MLNLNTFNEVLILGFHQEKYNKDSYYVEIIHAIDDFLFGLWVELKEGVGFPPGVL